MAETHSLTIIERVSGADLANSDVPAAPTILSSVGHDQLTIGWSLGSGGTTEEDVVIRYVATNLITPGWYMEINWGDGSAIQKVTAGGWRLDKKFVHEYTISTTVTITTKLYYRDTNNPITTKTLTFTPNVSANWAVSQIQFEKYEDGVRIYEPDWLDIGALTTSFVDDRVNRKHSYRYRYRFRLWDNLQQALVTSKFSPVTEKASWA